MTSLEYRGGDQSSLYTGDGRGGLTVWKPTRVGGLLALERPWTVVKRVPDVGVAPPTRQDTLCGTTLCHVLP